MLKITAGNGDEEDQSRNDGEAEGDDFHFVAAHKQPQRKETQRGVQYVKSRFCYTLCIRTCHTNIVIVVVDMFTPSPNLSSTGAPAKLIKFKEKQLSNLSVVRCLCLCADCLYYSQRDRR